MQNLSLIRFDPSYSINNTNDGWINAVDNSDWLMCGLDTDPQPCVKRLTRGCVSYHLDLEPKPQLSLSFDLTS
jgi:hypothetical protein